MTRPRQPDGVVRHARRPVRPGTRPVERARGTAGCLDFAIAADLIDPGRINIFERWESRAALDAARSSTPSDEQGAAILSASVADYDIADVRPFLEEGTA